MRLNEGPQWDVVTLLTCSCLCSVLAVVPTHSTAWHSHVCVGAAGYACLFVARKAVCLVVVCCVVLVVWCAPCVCS